MRSEDFSTDMPGRLVQLLGHPSGVASFVPDPLPREVAISPRIAKACESAAVHLGWVAGAGEILDPWLDLFLRREAIASSAIEGTFTTAHDLYLFEAKIEAKNSKKASYEHLEQQEVFNYVVAMGVAQELLKQGIPVSGRVMREAHRVLLQGVRGEDKRPGEFRVDQNWIGRTKKIEEARFVPPPTGEMLSAIADLERFIHEDSIIPNLVRLAMIHYQFETIHPFRDGNGRIGRLLMPLLLCAWGVLSPGPPRIYLSAYLEAHDQEYRDLMLRVSQKGDWESWFAFFIEAVRSEAESVRRSAEQLRELRAKYLSMVKGESGKLQTVVGHLFTRPVMQIRDIAAVGEVTAQQARNYARKLCVLGITSPGARSWRRFYIAREILSVFFKEETEDESPVGVEPEAPAEPAESTISERETSTNEPRLPFER